MAYAINSVSRILVEATKAQIAKSKNTDQPLNAVSVYIAHNWVMSGRDHETALWVDDGKIRRAYAGC